MFVTIIVFVAILALLIFVHEAGHFLTARRNGITCHEFGFGFPPRLIGVYRPAGTKKWKTIVGNKEYDGEKTLYSLNLIPLGGFVRIKGEDGKDKDPDSFAVQPLWVRFKVLIAGVVMNFVLAWILISIGLVIGVPEIVSQQPSAGTVIAGPRILVNTVEESSPAKMMGIKLGDVITEICGPTTGCVHVTTTDELIRQINTHRGVEVEIHGIRGKESLTYSGELRAKDSDKGGLGISMGETVVVKYPWYSALWYGLLKTLSLIVAILFAFGALIWGLISGSGVSGDVAGPVGIAQMTGQMRNLGIAPLLQFAALLSINLGIINALPIPALDGGRILFLLIEKIKGRPVNQKVEGYIHGISFMILIILMLLITARDILKFF